MDITTGRTQQKYRTRRALLAAARAVLQRKETVTIQAVADEAGISRATAYRYFPSSDYLLREALLDGAWETPEAVVGDATGVVERVLRVHAFLIRFTRHNEAAHRLFLAKALEASVSAAEDSLTLRGARRLPMFEHALMPVRGQMTEDAFRTLVVSLAAASGIETYVALKDVCGLDDAAADAISESNILAILARAVG